MIDLDALSSVLPIVLLAFAFVLGVLGAGHLFRLIWMLSLMVFLGILFWFSTQREVADASTVLADMELVRLAATYAGSLFVSIAVFLLARLMFAKTP